MKKTLLSLRLLVYHRPSIYRIIYVQCLGGAKYCFRIKPPYQSLVTGPTFNQSAQLSPTTNAADYIAPFTLSRIYKNSGECSANLYSGSFVRDGPELAELITTASRMY